MSFNEVVIFAVLVTIGFFSGILFGYRAATRGFRLATGLVSALSFGILVPLLILFLFAIREVSPRSTGVMDSLLAAFGGTIFYGIGTSLVTGPSALLACWITFNATRD
jgi:hypothetical protein